MPDNEMVLTFDDLLILVDGIVDRILDTPKYTVQSAELMPDEWIVYLTYSGVKDEETTAMFTIDMFTGEIIGFKRDTCLTSKK